MSAPIQDNAQAQAPIQQTYAEAPQQHIQQDTKVESHAAPAAAAPAANAGPMNDDDMKHWTDRFNAVIAKPSEHINSASPAGAQSWFSGFFDCFNPIDTCLVTYFVPCVTFGKTHHRMHKDSELKGYEPVNTTCLLMCGAGCVGCFCVPVAMQAQSIREKYNLEGSCVEDLLKAWCCGCCSIIQQDKEAEYREGLLRQNAATGVKQEYQPASGMAYPAQ